MSVWVNLKNAIEALIGPRLDYCKPWPATVATQNGDSVDVIPTDRDHPHMTVPLRVAAGVRVTLAPGTKCLVFFEDGDPTKPFAAAWDPDGVTEIRFCDGDSYVARVGDLVYVTIDVATAAQIAALAAPGGSGTVVLAGTIASGASRTKAN